MKKNAAHQKKPTGKTKASGRGINRKPVSVKNMTPAEINRLFEDLQTHQVELEAQNEELRAMQAELGSARDKYQDLYDFSPIAYLTLDEGDIIRDVNLTGIAFLWESLDQTMKNKSYPEQAGMEEIVGLIMESITNARNISRGLWGMRFDSNNASKVLADLALETRGFYKIKCLLHDTLSQPVDNSAIAMSLYNIARESIINSIKHGKADRIDILFHDDDESIFLEVLDNGRRAKKGYMNTKGIGIRIMQHRAELIGGTISTSALKKGFRVLVTIKKELIKLYLS
jgi:hypothetical protein